MNCLDLSNNDVQEWIVKEGIETTYKEFLDKGYLPDYKDWDGRISIPSAKILLDKFLPIDSFKIESLSDLMYSLPVETQAAYLNQVLYLTENPRKEEVYEEGFHAIFDTLLTSDEKKQALKAGQALLANRLKKEGLTINQYVKELVNKYPTIYGALKGDDRFNRAYEEELASMFVDSFEYKNEFNSEFELSKKLQPFFGDNAKSIASIINKVFNFFKKLFKVYDANRDTINTLFNQIKNGELKGRVIKGENSETVPATRLLNLYNTEYDDFLEEEVKSVTHALTSEETQRVIRNVGALFFQLESEKVLPDFNEKLDKAIELYFEFDSEFKNVDLNSVDNKESIDYLKSDIKDYIKTFSSLIDFEDETVESEDETSKEFAKYDSSANESSAFESSYSKQLKLRIGKTGKIKKYVDANGILQTHFTKNINGKDVKLKLIESVDVIKVYYAFARSLGNTSNDEERFNRLLKFSELKDNSDTKAFVDQLLYDLFANNDAVKDITGENEYENKISKIKELYNLQAPGFIIFPKNDNDVTISSNNASIINSILKGFDLWKRTDVIVTFDALTKTAKAFDANLNNVQNTQVNQWFATIEDIYNQLNKDKEEGKTIEFKFTKYNTFLGISSKQDLESVTEDIYFTLNKIGIKVSKDYIRYSVLSQSSKELLSDSDLATLLGNFKIPDTTILTPQVLEYIYTGINSYYSTGDIKSISTFSNKISIKGRLQDIAQGNGYFDENIPDNTFKGADGKTRYNYQYKTYHLQKIDEILKNPTDINTYKVLVAKDEYLEEGLDFIQNNYLFNKFGKEYKQQLDKGDIYSFSASGLRQQDTFKDANGKEIKIESDGESIGNMSNRDFMIYLLNLSAGLGTNSKGLLPVYFGNYEASKTYEFINLPVIKDLIDEQGLTELGVQLFKTEIEKEYNRIKKLSKENINTIYTKYNSGNRIKINSVDNTKSFYIPFNVKDGVRTINFANFRGQQFSDYVGGLVDDRHYNIPDEILKELNTLINSNNEFEFTLIKDLNPGDNLLMNAILGNDIPDINNSIKTNVENILDSTFNMFETEGIVEQVKDKQGKPVYSNGNPIYNNILLDSFYNGRTKNSLEFGFKVGDLQGNLKKTIVSSLLNTMYANQLMQGDQALLYKNDAVDMFKRFKGRNAAIVSFNTSTIAPKLGIYNKWLTLDYVVHSEVEAKSGINLGNIDQADAQNYTTVNYMRHALYAMGRLSPEMANVLDAIEQGEDTSINDVKIIDQELYTSVLKTVHFDGRNYLKKSDAMLSKRLTSKFIKITEQEALLHGYEDNYGRWKPSIGATKEVVRWSDGSYHEVVPRQEKVLLHDRRKVMEGWRFDNNQWVYNGREIMLSMPISASKMLNRNTLKGHDLKNVKDENINTLDLQYYGLQVETAKPHDKIPDPTQYLLIALNELNRKGITKFIIDNKEYNVNELEDLYEEALTARDNIRIDELKEELKDVEEFRNRFAHSLESSGAEKQTIDLVTKNFNLNNPLIKDKYIAQIFSHFTKDGLSQKRAGDAAPHVSSYGMKLIKKVVKHTVNGKDLWSWTVVPTDSDEYNSVPEGLKDLSEHDFYPDVNNIKHEKYVNNRLQDELEKLGEGQYFIDELRHLKPRVENNKITGYFDEMVLSKFDAKQKNIYDTQKYMFGVRIPSQDKHSGVNVEWVDILPAHYGSVVSVPKEIVQLSGHDFDVDKLYISKPEGYYTKEGFKQYENTFEDFIKYQLSNNKRLNKLIKDGINQERALKAIGLPHDELTYKAYIKKYGYSNRGYINNILLQANQQALANDQTLNSGSADTAASMGYLANGVLKEFKLSDGTYLLSNDGKSYVNTNKVKYNVHSMLGHIITHKNNNTGKANIGIDVNWNLLDIVLNKLNVEVNPNNAITVNINGVDKTFGSLELFLQGENIIKYSSNKLVEYVNKLIPGFISSKEDEIELATTFKTFELLDKEKTEEELKVEEKNLVQTKQRLLNGIKKYKEGNKELEPLKYEMVASLILAELIEQGIPLKDVYTNIFNLGKQSVKEIEDKKPVKQGLRVFDVLSTMISSATDEAKEQLNARYGLNVDALNAVLPFVAMGGNLSIAIAIVNQPIVQDFLKYKSKKNYAVLTKDESQYKFINDNKIVGLLFNSYGIDNADLNDLSIKNYSVEFLAKGLRGQTNITSNESLAVLRDFLRLSEISQYGNNLIAAIKLSKGLPSDLYKFQSMVDKIKAIGLNDRNYDPSLVPLDIKNAILNNPSKSKSIVNKINIVNEIDGLLPQYIALKSALMTKYKQELLIQLGKENLGATIQREIDNELESFIYGQLVYKGLENAAEQDALLLKHLRSTLIDSVAQENTIVQMFNSLKDYIVNVPELKENSLIKKLQVIDDDVISYLKLNQLVKLTDTQMTELSDAFTYLSNYPKEINGISPLEFTKALQALYIIKDGMQFKFEGISKVFPVESLSRIDKAINDVMKGDYKDLSNESYINEFIKRYFESIKHVNSVKRLVLDLGKDKDDFSFDPDPEKGQGFIIIKNDTVKKAITTNGKAFKFLSIGINFGDSSDIIYNNYRLKSYKESEFYYEEYLPQGTSNSTLMSVPYNPVIKSSNLNTIDNTINEVKDVNADYKYYGSWYKIKLDDNNKGIDVIDYKGKNVDKQKLLSKFNENPNIDPQSGKPFITETSNQEQPITKNVENEFSYKGKSIKTLFELGEEQKEILKELVDFVNDSKENIITVQGKAGTGKTSLIGYLQKYYGNSASFAYIAPTHVAVANLAFNTVKTGNTSFPSTVASATTTDIEGNIKFASKVTKTLGYNPVIVLDEASMLDENDVRTLEEAVKNGGYKLIYLGDYKQIPKVFKGNKTFKKISPVFKDYRVLKLNTVYRTGDTTLLQVLSKIWDSKTFKLFKSNNFENLKFVSDKSTFEEELKKDVEKDPTNTIVIAYSNSSVSTYNKKIRQMLDKPSNTVEGDILMGYIGYGNKQIEKQDVANSVSYILNKIQKEGSRYYLQMESPKLKELIKLGIKNIRSEATTFYYPLSDNESLSFKSTKEEQEANNQHLSSIFREIYNANLEMKSKKIKYWDYLAELQSLGEQLRSFTIGDNYVYNPLTDRMEKYNAEKHKDIQTTGQGSLLLEKGIDYGHAITSHKSQSLTIDNVYFDASTLIPQYDVPIVDSEGEQITTEMQSIAYVSMSRNSKKLVVYEGNINFENISDAKDISSNFTENKQSNNMEINFQEEQTLGYRNRTIKNASADATIALATDFNTAGEKLTKSSVLQQGKKYIPIDANSLSTSEERVNKIVEYLNSVNAKTLNIAGNGIYSMKQYTQQQIDDFTFELLNKVLNSPKLNTKIESIRSGGQTGFDEAGAKAGIKLGIKTLILAPKGFTFRVTKSVYETYYKPKGIVGRLVQDNYDISDESSFKNRFIENKQQSDIKGINIYSKSEDILGRKLTNPNWYAKNLMDVETPYKANASKIKAPHLNPEDALRYDMNLMYKLQVQKFQKNPELIDEINERGGLQFILNSEHTVGVKNSRWEGKGINSNFIKVLAKSYETVAKELNKFQNKQQSDDEFNICNE